MNTDLRFRVPSVERNFRMSDSDGRDFVFRELQAGGLASYEKPLPSVLIAYLNQRPGTFVDVGANTGLYALLAAATSSEISVLAFEPLSKIHDQLLRNIALNEGYDRRITPIREALSNQVGSLTFYETINDQGFLSTSSTLDEAHAKRIGAEYLSTRVPVTTLDIWSERNPITQLSFMKIDVEGHERGVVEGATATIATHRPIMSVELLSAGDFEYFSQFARDTSYSNFEIEPDVVRQEEVIAFNPKSWNHIFCPLEKTYAFLAAARSAGLEIV